MNTYVDKFMRIKISKFWRTVLRKVKEMKQIGRNICKSNNWQSISMKRTLKTQ